jgi:hypothetical protein
MYKLKILDKGKLSDSYLDKRDSDNVIIVCDRYIDYIKKVAKVEVLSHYHVIPVMETCSKCGHKHKVSETIKVLK